MQRAVVVFLTIEMQGSVRRSEEGSIDTTGARVKTSVSECFVLVSESVRTEEWWSE